MRLVAVLIAALLLAGCTQDAPVAPDDPEPAFDGSAAYGFVEGLVTAPDGTPRFRVPGTPGHASAADWLEEQMMVDGWDVSRQTFTGEDYLALDRSATSSWNHACPEEDEEAVAGLTMHNLIATHGPEDPMVWLGAHWDSKEDADQDDDPAKHGEPVLGANDGASGVGLWLQFMRHVSAGDIDVPFGLGVVFFDAEDGFADCHPLAGSTYFAQTMQEGLVDRFILLDMVGDDEAQFVREGNSLAADGALVDLLWEHGQVRWPEAFTDRQRSVVDDHIPLIEQGVPAVDLIDFGRTDGRFGFPPYWHTTGDTMEHISVDALAKVGDVVWATLTDERFEI